MSPRRQQITNGLQWVRNELDQSLARARGLIEQYIENPKDMLPLQQAFVELHQMRGTAAMIQCFGVSAFGEEMRQAVRELMHDKVKQTDDAYTALLGAIVQIGDYIDALASGMDDCVLVLHPAINELRLARNKSILSEADLFAAQMNSLGLHLPVPAGDQNRQEGFAQAHARKLEPVFMAALLQWLKNQPDNRPALARMGKAAEQIAAVAVTPPVYQLWRTVAAIIEGLLTQTLEDSLELKRLFGTVGKQLKLLADSGEKAAAAKQGDLAFQLLFYAGRSDGQGPRVSSIRQAFELDAYLPPANQVEALRQKIHGPTTQLLSKVAEEIRVDLGQIKDNIDLAVRSAGGGVPDLGETRQRMKRVADTLATLGLQVLQRVVANQVLVIEGANEANPPSVEAWMDMATAILRVEHSLDSALFRQLRQSPLEQAVGKPELEEHVPHSMDLSEGRQALLRESLISLSRLKDSVDTYVRTGESIGLVEAAKTLNEVASGLLILEAYDASALVTRLERHVKSPNVALLRESSERADRFADAISCIEYFLEGLRDRTPQGEGMLATLGKLLDYLDSTTSKEAPERLAPQPAPAAPAPEAAVVAAPAEEIDPEIRSIFVEEAGEVREQLEAAVPNWAHNLQNRDALTTIRRAFHTLKGSGRMVGASSIGDFGWALESMLNRCLESAVAINQDVLETVQQALALLPALIEEFQHGGSGAGEQLKSLVARANRLAAGETSGSAEPDMLAIFHEDAREKLEMIGEWLTAQDRSEQNIAISNDVVRAFHTLRGAAAIVGLTSLAELAGALETFMDSTRGAGLGLTPAGMTLLDGAVGALRQWAEPGTTTPSNAAKPWLDRIDQLQQQVPESAVQATADRQLAEVFGGEAFDLVSKIEKAAGEWSRAPENRQVPREMLTAFQTLMGAALMSHAPAIANVSRALHNRMQEAVASSVVPDAGFFTRLGQIIEGIYQQLDSYQLGDFAGDGAALAAEIYGMQWTGEGAESLRELGEIIEMPPVEPSAEFVPPPQAAPVPPPAAYAAEADPELLSIFLAEAQELLQNLDGYSAAWEQNPQAWQAANEVKRVLHTLKGSARMAALPNIGEVAHRLEKLVVQTTRGEVALDAAFFGRLHQWSDRLHALIDEMQRGSMPDMSALLEEFDTPQPLPKPRVAESAPPAELTGAPSADAEEAPIEMPAVAEDVEAPAVQTVSAQVESAEAFSDIDTDLAEVFTAEAAELLEELEKSLGQLASNPRDTDALRDIQRVL
ncbi:MAG TPA: Hpt domain-containing protein, partial [Nevskiaceae bacterium]|nr:Hpt domain-containing protein [Nevskiaceae bacterium]